MKELTERAASRAALLYPSLCALLVGCAPEEVDTSSTVWAPESIDTLVTATSSSIGLVADLIVAADGRVWIADVLNHQLHIVDPSSKQTSTVARQGDGPGELQQPRALAADQEGVLALQPQVGRLSRFSLDGRFLDSRETLGGMLVPISLAQDQTAAFPSLGLEGSLAVRVDLATRDRMLLGTALAERPAGMSMARLREQALREEFPQEFRNNVLPVVNPDGRVWIISQFTGQVTAFNTEGDSVWSVSLDPGLVRSAHQVYFDAVRAEPARVQVPIVAADAVLVGEELWVVVVGGAEESSIVRVSTETGAALGQVQLHGLGAGLIAVDRTRGRLYLAVPEEALMVAIELPRRILD